MTVKRADVALAGLVLAAAAAVAARATAPSPGTGQHIDRQAAASVLSHVREFTLHSDATGRAVSLECLKGIGGQGLYVAGGADACDTYDSFSAYPSTGWREIIDQGAGGQCMSFEPRTNSLNYQPCKGAAAYYQWWNSKQLPGGGWVIWTYWEELNNRKACPGGHQPVMTVNPGNAKLILACPQGPGGSSFSTAQQWTFRAA